MATQPQGRPLAPPAQDERTLAFLAHLLQIFSGFIGPLVIFCVKQDSRFVRFHSLQALVWQACYMVLIFFSIMVCAIGLLVSVLHNPEAVHSQGPPPGLFVFFPLIWLIMMGGWVANLILGLVFGIKANNGEWAAYPVIGKWFLPKND
jgi:uncharacterized protein